MKKLSQYNRDKLIDLLSERLAFERSGVKLYDSILQKISNNPEMAAAQKEFQHHRQEEKEHEEWLEEQIRNLGGTAHEMTERVQLIERESKGITEVVNNDRELPHLFHALLTAELVDNAGWDLLIQLADEAEDREAVTEFEKRKNEEGEHLMFARRLVFGVVRHQVLGRSGAVQVQP